MFEVVDDNDDDDDDDDVCLLLQEKKNIQSCLAQLQTLSKSAKI